MNYICIAGQGGSGRPLPRREGTTENEAVRNDCLLFLTQKKITMTKKELLQQANKLLRAYGKKGVEYTMPRQPSKVRSAKQERQRQKRLK